jgi:predicted nucleic acid-binding protein
MKALLDTNIVLDVILDRPQFEPDSGAVWAACDAGRLVGCISAITLTTIYYVVRKTRGHQVALSAIDQCLAAFEILPIQRETILLARSLTGTDFEDNVQCASALAASADCIVTRDSTGFSGAPLIILTAPQILARLPKP